MPGEENTASGASTGRGTEGLLPREGRELGEAFWDIGPRDSPDLCPPVWSGLPQTTGTAHYGRLLPSDLKGKLVQYGLPGLKGEQEQRTDAV